jgi:hypothetical protein
VKSVQCPFDASDLRCHLPSARLSRQETIVQILTALSSSKLNADVGRRGESKKEHGM